MIVNARHVGRGGVRPGIRWLTVAAATALAAVVGAPIHAGAATGPGGNGRIVFERESHDVVQIFKMAPNGAAGSQLTTVGQNYAPSWSPNGRTVAFVSERNGGSQLFLMGANGTDQRVIDTGGACVSYPSWSPDGRRLVFSRWADAQCNGAPDLWTVRSDGTHLNQLTKTIVDRELQPKWSPDGSRIAFASHTGAPGTYAVFTINSGGSDRKRVTPAWLGASFPDWSPDGRSLAVTTGMDDPEQNIYTVDANGQHVSRVTRRTPGVSSFLPVWSPDGKLILFSSNRYGDQFDLYTVRLRDGVERRRTCTAVSEYGSSWQAAAS